MRPRVAYFTSSFRPEMESIAAEVAFLRQAFPGSIVWGISRRDRGCFSWKSGFAVPPSMHLAFRGATQLLQRGFHINHLFGGLGDWFHLKAVRRGPTVMTVALPAEPCTTDLLRRVDKFVVEWPDASETLLAFGIKPHQICEILPPADLQRFAPSPRPKCDFTVLFASSPDRSDWLPARGVDAILAAAALRPQMRFVLAWRPWGDSLSAVRAAIEDASLRNVVVRPGIQSDMASLYQSAHVTAVPFRDLTRCKPAPNSLIESLACGRPVVATPEVKLSPLVRRAGAGVICNATGEEIAHSLDLIEADWQQYSHCARKLAEDRFGLDCFIDAYDRLYRQIV